MATILARKTDFKRFFRFPSASGVLRRNVSLKQFRSQSFQICIM